MLYGIVAKVELREAYAIITAQDGTQHLVVEPEPALAEMAIVEVEPCQDETGIAHITKVIL